MHIIFGKSQQDRPLKKYDGRGNPRHHINDCVTNWRLVPPGEWMHYFIHTLYGIPSNWYKEQALCRETASWGTVQQNFIRTFSFESENPWVNLAFKRIKKKIFEEYVVDTVTVDRDYRKETLEKLVYCYWITEDEEAEENPGDIQIVEGQGERGLEGPLLQLEEFTAPMKIKKVNFGTQYKPKIVNIGDYWDNETMEKTIKLLHEYSDLFPATFP
jgi:hypothetical protein